jgi:hypothetical protein
MTLGLQFLRSTPSRGRFELSAGRSHTLLLAITLLLPLAIYWRTAFPTLHTADVAEFSTAAVTLGIVHSPGYVTYLPLAHLALLFPHADAARLLNLLSGLTAALTVTSLALLVSILTGSRLAAAAAALFFAFTHYQWSEAVLATPYTVNTLWLILDLLLMLRWRSTRGLAPLAALALLYGLQPGLHASSLLQAPAFALLLLGTDWRWFRSAPRLLALGGLGLLGLSSWLYLPVRAAAGPPIQFAQGIGLDLTNPHELLLYVSADPFRDFLLNAGPRQLPAQLGQTLGWHWRNYLGLGILVGLAGLGAQWRRDRLLAASLGLGFLVHLTFYTLYQVGNRDTMFLPAYLLWAIWLGEGLTWLLSRAPRARHAPLALVVLLLPLFPLLANFGREDASQNRQARDFAEAVLDIAAPSSAVLGYFYEATPVQYLQIVEGRRPDVELVNLSLPKMGRLRQLRGLVQPELASRLFDLELATRLRERLQNGQSVYLLNEVAQPLPGLRLVPEGPTFRVELDRSKQRSRTGPLLHSWMGSVA